jgi:signal transduction histidine kinase
LNGRMKVSVSCIEGSNGKRERTVRLQVEDDGPGIAPDHLDRIFEPFFTTKKDVGTGLGLWVSKEIVNRHGGIIQVESRRDNGSHGTVFNVLLPCSADVQAEAATAG